MIYYWYQLSYILLIPAFIFALWAQINVKTTFNRTNKVRTCMTGVDAARSILNANGLSHISIERIPGKLTDHYDPKANVIRLSEDVYDNSSAAAVGVAAHEAGHAVQYAVGYSPIRLRMAIIPVTSFSSRAAMPLFFIGMIFSMFSNTESNLGWALMMTGILFFSFAVFFQMVTLPVEFNASRRAMAALGETDMKGEQLVASRKVLNAAALTYVAALAVSLLNLLRLLAIASGGRRR